MSTPMSTPGAPATGKTSTAPELMSQLKTAMTEAMSSLGQAHVMISSNNIDMNQLFLLLATAHAHLYQSNLLASNVSGEMRAYALAREAKPTDSLSTSGADDASTH